MLAATHQHGGGGAEGGLGSPEWQLKKKKLKKIHLLNRVSLQEIISTDHTSNLSS